MASVFRRTWWIDKRGRRCAPHARGARHRVSKRWTIKIGGRLYRGFCNHAETLKLARKMQARYDRGSRNLAGFEVKSRREGLLGHVHEWVKELRGQGVSTAYPSACRNRLRRLIRECAWASFADVTVESFLRWRDKAQTNASDLAKERAKAKHVPLSARTKNHYLNTASAFFNWAIRRGRWRRNPLLHVKRVKETERRRARRALSPEEARRLLAVLGDDFRLVYETALTTGLRRAELRALRWMDLNLEPTNPYIQLRAAANKSARTDRLPLRRDLAEKLRIARGDAKDNDRVFRWVPTIKRHIRHLKAAGIPYVDALGRRADWHALRTTFGTMLCTSGVVPRVAMELMRHSDLRLTMSVYTDWKLLDLARAVEALPSLSPVSDQPAVAGHAS